MRETQLVGDRVRIQYSPVPKPDGTSGRPGLLMVVEAKPDAVALELDSSFDANLRKPQFDLGGEA